MKQASDFVGFGLRNRQFVKRNARISSDDFVTIECSSHFSIRHRPSDKIATRACWGTTAQDSMSSNNSLSIDALNGQLVPQACSAGAARIQWGSVQVLRGSSLTSKSVRGSTPRAAIFDFGQRPNTPRPFIFLSSNRWKACPRDC